MSAGPKTKTFSTELDLETYKSLVELAPSISYVAALDDHSTTLYVSPQIETVLGVSREDYVADPEIWSKLIHPEDRLSVLQELKKCQAEGKPFHFEYRMVGPDGRIVWFRDQAVIVRDSNGKPLRLQGAMLDITGEKIAHQMASKSGELNEKIFREAPIGISIYKSDGRTISANTAVSAIVGTNLNKILNQNFRQLVSWETSGLLDAAENTLETGNENRVIVNLVTTFGRNAWLDCRFARIRSEDEYHLLLLTADITELKNVEHEIRVHRDHLDDLVRERTSELISLNRKLLEEIDRRQMVEAVQVRFQNSLKKSQENLRALLDAINESAFLMDLDGTVLSINETAASRLGYTAKEISGKNLYDFISDDLGTERKNRVLEVVKTQKTIRFEDVRGDKTIDQTVSPVFGPDGKVSGIAVFAMDITDRRRIEKSIKESEELFRLTFEQAAVGIVHANMEGRLIRFNERFSEIVGYPRETLLNLTFQEITDPAFLEIDLSNMYKLLEGEIENYIIEKQYIRLDNSRVWAQLTVSLRRHPDGTPYHFIGVVQDITQRKVIEQELSSSEQFLSNVFSSIQDGLSILDTDLNILRVNPAMERWYAHAMPLTGKKCYEAYYGADKPCSVCPTCAAIATGKQAFEEVPLTGDDGVVKGWVDLFAFPMFDPKDGRLTGVIEFVRDISNRKLAEKVASDYKEHLERLNRELEKFAYVASHDLREPLRKVAGFSELLERRYKGKLDEKADKYLFYILDGVQRMQRLIEDLLAYSRLGRNSENQEFIKTTELAHSVLLDLSELISENHASVEVHDLPDIIGHEIQIRQLFQNLIANAIKFRRDEAPKVLVSCSISNDEAVFSVQDNGIGIDPDQFERVFGIFQRLHSREQYPGTGIGLAVCKKIVELHGGHIWIESEPGKGSVFKFSLKLVGKGC